MHSFEKTATITSATYFCDDVGCKLLLGDEKGTIRMLDLKDVINALGIKKVETDRLGTKPRNHTRLADHDMKSGNIDTARALNRKNSNSSIASEEVHASSELEFVAKPLKDDYLGTQIQQWKGHSDAIKYLSVINETEGMSFFSAGLDNMAKL